MDTKRAFGPGSPRLTESHLPSAFHPRIAHESPSDHRVFSIPLLAAGGVGAAQAPPSGRSAFRVRADFTVALNEDRGWAGALNENVTVYADRPFRIRFEAQSAGAARQLWLQYRHNGREWTA